MENLIKIADLGVPPFSETPKCQSLLNFFHSDSYDYSDEIEYSSMIFTGLSRIPELPGQHSHHFSIWTTWKLSSRKVHRAVRRRKQLAWISAVRKVILPLEGGMSRIPSQVRSHYQKDLENWRNSFFDIALKCSKQCFFWPFHAISFSSLMLSWLKHPNDHLLFNLLQDWFHKMGWSLSFNSSKHSAPMRNQWKWNSNSYYMIVVVTSTCGKRGNSCWEKQKIS